MSALNNTVGLTQKVIEKNDNTKQKTQARACIQKYITVLAMALEKRLLLAMLAIQKAFCDKVGACYSAFCVSPNWWFIFIPKKKEVFVF